MRDKTILMLAKYLEFKKLWKGLKQEYRINEGNL